MRFNIVAILVMTAVLAGCSGSSAKNPIAPSDLTKNQAAIESNHHLWGIWDVRISADHQTVQIAPFRTADMHLNVVKLLEVKPCSTCLKIDNLIITGLHELSVDVTLSHPFPGLLKYTGFDVRGIFISTADYTFPTSGRKIALGDIVPRMLDPDGYTSLFNPAEFLQTIPAALGYIPGKHSTGGDLSANLNPFIAYRKDAPRRMFEAGGSETKTVKIHAPSGLIHFGYAVDVCWEPVDDVVDPLIDFPMSANCLEAYELRVNVTPGLQPFVGSSTPVEVEVYDHQGQDTISSVMIEAPDLITGETSLVFSTAMPDGGFLFSGTLSNDLGTGVGYYPVLVKASDTQADQNLGEIAAWQVSWAAVTRNGWARTWGGSDDDTGWAVATDGSGSVYVSGYFCGTVDFDPGPVIDNHTSIGECGFFLSKFDPNGSFVWARTWGGSDYKNGNSVAIDGNGNAYVTGHFLGTADFDPGLGVDNHTSNGLADVFLSKFDPDGNFVWARTWGGSDDDLGWSVAIDDSGNPYVTGGFEDSVDFDPGGGVDNHTSNGVWDAFLSKFDSSGNYLWVRTWGGLGWDEGDSVAIDGSGNPYITGWFTDTVDFDPGAGLDNHTSIDGYSFFLSKFDPNGNFVWARTWGGTYWANENSVAIDGSGNAYVAGYFDGTVDFDPGAGVDNHTSNGLHDAFLSKFDPDGNFVWAHTWGGSGVCYGRSVAIDSSGNAYITGSFSDTVDFDPGGGVDIQTPNGTYDVFLTKFDSNGNHIWARTWGGENIDEGWSVAVDGSGNAYVTGWFADYAVDFDPGPGVDNHTPNGMVDVFLSKFPPYGNW